MSIIDSSPDKVRVKIWKKAAPGVVVYDSLKDGVDVAPPTQTATTGPSTVMILH